MLPGSQRGLATMIRSLPLLAIGLALTSALILPSFGGSPEQAVAVAAQEKAAPRAAAVQGRPGEAAAAASPATAATEKAVREALAAFIAAYNGRDAAKLAESFTQDGRVIDSENIATEGRDAIAEEFSE